MTIQIKKIFNKDKNIVIGALHFPPLLGFKEFPGFKIALKNAVEDLHAFEDGGVDAIFLENNYGLSDEKITNSQAIAMGYLCGELRKLTDLPLGASVLWNDYETAFSLASTYNLQFIRVPVFVDTVKPYCGIIEGNPKDVINVRKELGAENVAIFNDILVKHSEHVSKNTLEESTLLAIENESDGVIVTGDWTGKSPSVDALIKLRKKIGDFPLLVGSGVNNDNIVELSQVSNALIVSTSLKFGCDDLEERNIKGYEQRVDKAMVKNLINTLNEA